METRDNRARIAICLAFVVFAALVIAIFSMNSVQKYEIDDLTPLATTSAVSTPASNKLLKLDIDATKDYGVIGLCFKNTETKDKYLVDFTSSEGYVKDLNGTLPLGEYKVSIVNAGKLGKSTVLPKAITVADDSAMILIKFK